MRINTVGFEIGRTIPSGVEIFNLIGNPVIREDIVHGGKYACQMRYTVSSGADFISIVATTRNGAGYFRDYIYIESLPDVKHAFTAFKRGSDSLNMAGIEMGPDGRLQFFYRNDSETRTNLGVQSGPLLVGQWYCIEYGIIGNESGTNRHFEARVNGQQFMAADVSDQSSYDGYHGFGYDLDPSDGAFGGSLIFDDIAVNDGSQTDRNGVPTTQNSWCGPGAIVMLQPTGVDDLGNNGWQRGGVDTGSDWMQVNYFVEAVGAALWNDTETLWNDPVELWAGIPLSYLISETDGDQIDFTMTNPYDLGLVAEDKINVVSGQVRWRQEGDSDSSFMDVYLRAGSGLPKQSRNIGLFDTDWWTGDGSDQELGAIISTSLPELATSPWTVDELSGLRFGMQTTDSSPHIDVDGIWVMVEYVPYQQAVDYKVLIDGVERTTDVQAATLVIDDILYDQANDCNFYMEPFRSGGALPETDQVIEVWLNGVQLFGGLISRVTFNQVTNNLDTYYIECVDYTRELDRRLVAATFNSMIDSDIVNAIVDQFAGEQGITTYHVSPGAMVAQLSEDYIPCSQALTDLTTLTGRFWYIDYQKDIHYFPLAQNKAPFDLTPDGDQFDTLQIINDSSQLRNRVFVKGGVEATTEPFTESQVADGVQTTFLLANQPLTPFTMTLNGVAQTVGIGNVDDPTTVDFLLFDTQQYVGLGTAATPNPGDVLAFTYNYNFPVLVSIEDTNSVNEDGAYEYAIIDSTIATLQEARDRASAELADYAKTLVTATYNTMVSGIRSGQYQHMTFPEKGIDDDYVVSQVTFNSLGGGLFYYTITLTNAKMLGIIRFLMDMLKINRTIGTFDPNASVDGFFGVNDVMDSLTDSLQDSLGGTAAKWSNDPGTTTNKLKWDLGQWQ